MGHQKFQYNKNKCVSPTKIINESNTLINLKRIAILKKILKTLSIYWEKIVLIKVTLVHIWSLLMVNLGENLYYIQNN